MLVPIGLIPRNLLQGLPHSLPGVTSPPTAFENVSKGWHIPENKVFLRVAG